MANLRPPVPHRPMPPTAQDKTQHGGPPSGSAETMGPPAKIMYHGKPHPAAVGQHVKVTIHGKVAGHTMAGNVEGGQPGQGAPSSSLELSPHTMTVEPAEGSPAEEAGESPALEAQEQAAGVDKVGAAKGTGRPKTAGGGGMNMVDSINSIKKKYRPLRGTAGPVS